MSQVGRGLLGLQAGWAKGQGGLLAETPGRCCVISGHPTQDWPACQRLWEVCSAFWPWSVGPQTVHVRKKGVLESLAPLENGVTMHTPID